VRLGRYDRLPTCCAFATGPNDAIRHRRRPISTVNASIATTIRASRLAVEEIEAEFADVKVSAVEKWRLRRRAGLVRELLTGAYHPPRRDLERGRLPRVVLLRCGRFGRW
jgi:hypothetical protein